MYRTLYRRAVGRLRRPGFRKRLNYASRDNSCLTNRSAVVASATVNIRSGNRSFGRSSSEAIAFRASFDEGANTVRGLGAPRLRPSSPVLFDCPTWTVGDFAPSRCRIMPTVEGEA